MASKVTVVLLSIEYVNILFYSFFIKKIKNYKYKKNIAIWPYISNKVGFYIKVIKFLYQNPYIDIQSGFLQGYFNKNILKNRRGLKMLKGITNV